MGFREIHLRRNAHAYLGFYQVSTKAAKCARQVPGRVKGNDSKSLVKGNNGTSLVKGKSKLRNFKEFMAWG
jgi:hypothetical protein